MNSSISVVDQIMELRESCTPTEVGRLGKVLRVLPRTIALALVFNEDEKILVDPGFDAHKNEKFYRLLGGGVDFSEPTYEAVVRELKEETGIDAVAHERLGVFENIFTFEGKSFHEIVFVYRVTFCTQADYEREEISVSDTRRKATTASWKSLGEIKQEGAKLYPEGLESAPDRGRAHPRKAWQGGKAPAHVKLWLGQGPMPQSKESVEKISHSILIYLTSACFGRHLAATCGVSGAAYVRRTTSCASGFAES